MDKVTCLVALGGDIRSVVPLGPSKNVTWAEVQLLREVHGMSSVTDIEVIGELSEEASADERARLAAKYGEEMVRKVFYTGKVPDKAPSDIPRWDDEVEIVVRKPRAAPKAKKEEAPAKLAGDAIVKPSGDTIFDP